MEVMLGEAVVPKRPGRRPSLINKYTVPGIPCPRNSRTDFPELGRLVMRPYMPLKHKSDKWPNFLGHKPLNNPRINMFESLILFVVVASSVILYGLQYLLYYLFISSKISLYLSYDAAYACICGILFSCFVWSALFFQSASFELSVIDKKSL